MRIYDSNQTGAALNTGRAQETQALSSSERQSASGRTTDSTDRVEFSNSLGFLSRALANLDGARAQKVQELAALHQSGNLDAKSLDTSRALVTHALAGGAD